MWDPANPIAVLLCDASDKTIGSALNQLDPNGYPYSISFESRSMNEAETHYPTREKELLAIFHAFTKWRYYLMGRHVLVYTDHQSLTTLPTQKVLSHRVYRWLEYLENFNYEIKYLCGENNQVADALSRLKDAPPLHPEESISSVQLQIQDPFIDQIRDALLQDSFAQTILSSLKAQDNAVINKTYSEWKN